MILLTVVLGVTAYLWWRDGGTFGPRPTVEYSRLQVSAEMAIVIDIAITVKLLVA